MDAQRLEFLSTLLSTPGTSGFEQAVQEVVRNYVADFTDECSTDHHGNVIAVVNPGCEQRVMLAGHCDQIGLLISHIDEQGYLYAQTIGGWDPQQLIGQRMTIWTADGAIPGVIARKPIHLLSDDERKQVVKVEDMWIDIGARTFDEASELVRIGDPVTLQLGMQTLRNGLANAPAMDDRTGLWVVMEALRRAKNLDLNCSVYAVSTVQEEIGLRGATTAAYGINPTIGIAVDVTHATDCPTIDKRQRGDIQLGNGPVVFRGPNMNPRVVELLCQVGASNEIDYQLASLGRAAPNDSNALQLTRDGVAAGLVAIPNRYMHSAVETISLDDIDRAADLLANFTAQIDDQTNLIP